MLIFAHTCPYLLTKRLYVLTPADICLILARINTSNATSRHHPRPAEQARVHSGGSRSARAVQARRVAAKPILAPAQSRQRGVRRL